MSALFKVGECRVCHKNCLWFTPIDGMLADFDVCSSECLTVVLDELKETGEVQGQLAEPE